ncbi:hypothetical protein EYC80_005168 [Monilinia laxa]|uniref:Uncharacterized protein n=1 Tax=Monilinia laxa TaxID=61186 RepID=A0A5N6KJB1_MONLA|nr:hypothetical protein EYC80_005168 [Monilinia laxa]
MRNKLTKSFIHTLILHHQLLLPFSVNNSSKINYLPNYLHLLLATFPLYSFILHYIHQKHLPTNINSTYFPKPVYNTQNKSNTS